MKATEILIVIWWHFIFTSFYRLSSLFKKKCSSEALLLRMHQFFGPSCYWSVASGNVQRLWESHIGNLNFNQFQIDCYMMKFWMLMPLYSKDVCKWCISRGPTFKSYIRHVMWYILCISWMSTLIILSTCLGIYKVLKESSANQNCLFKNKLSSEKITRLKT